MSCRMYIDNTPTNTIIISPRGLLKHVCCLKNTVSFTITTSLFFLHYIKRSWFSVVKVCLLFHLLYKYGSPTIKNQRLKNNKENMFSWISILSLVSVIGLLAGQNIIYDINTQLCEL